MSITKHKTIMFSITRDDLSSGWCRNQLLIDAKWYFCQLSEFGSRHRSSPHTVFEQKLWKNQNWKSCNSAWGVAWELSRLASRKATHWYSPVSDLLGRSRMYPRQMRLMQSWAAVDYVNVIHTRHIKIYVYKILRNTRITSFSNTWRRQ
jgi:hypothetical protein